MQTNSTFLGLNISLKADHSAATTSSTHRYCMSDSERVVDLGKKHCWSFIKLHMKMLSDAVGSTENDCCWVE